MGRSTRPTVGTARRRAGALVMTILVVLLLGVEPVPAAEAAEAAETAETAETAAAAPAQVDCPAYLFMGSRGSGQPKPGADGDQHRGLGREIDDLYTRLDQQVPDGRLGLWVNDYPAISVPAAGVAALIDLLTAASHDAALNLTRYAESVGAGVRKLEAAIEERLAACADTQLILAGYSQGGQVTLDTYQSLDAGQRARVAAVVSFGDPYFNGGSPAARGDFSPRRHGMLTFPSALRKRPELPDAGSGKVLSFCHQRDPVCQGLLPSFSMAQHLNYDSVGDAASDVAYTRRAAACVALRVGHPGAAGGPTARITPPARAVAGEPIELSAAQSTDPACEPLLYAWSIDGGAHQPAPPTGDPRRTVTLPAGSHTVDLRVTTNSGEEATQRLTLEVVAAGPDDGGPPGAPTGVVSTPADDGGSATLTWEPPARGPPPQWYSVATTDGFPLYVGRAEDGRSLTLPADTLPVTVVVAAHNTLGQGPPSAPVAMAAGELGTAGDLDALWRAYGDAGGHWTGGDSTTSVALPDERVAWLFSDTFLGTVNADGSRPRDTPFVHNTLVVQEDDGRLGATLTGGTSSAPRSLVEVDGSDELHWVADGHVEGDSLRVLYNTYETTGAGPLDVGLTGTSLATFSLPDLELTDLVELPLGDTVAWGSAILDDGGYTYVYGSEDPGDGVRFAHVARVERGDLGAAWEFFDGTGWTDDEAASARLFRGVGTAYDVVSVGDRYALVTQDSNIVFSSAYVAYTADRPTGPFTGPLPLFDAPQEYPGKPVITYDARVHTAFSGRGGLTVSYNVNSLDPDDNYADASIYRPRFLDVPWPPAAPDPTTVPGPPRTLTAANGAEGLVRLTWQPPATGPAPTGYRVYQRDVTAGQTTFSRYTNTWTGTSADLGLLRDGHTYELRVTAQNAQGEGPPSNTATLAVDHRPPPAPANLRAEATGRGLVRLDWDATSANVVHTVHQRDVTAGEADFTTVPFPNPSLTTLTVGPLTHGHEYEFQVTAGHGGGDSAPSNPARATAHWPPPPTPTGLTATSGADGDIELSWNAPADDVWYWVYQRDVTGGEVELTKLELPVTDADDVVHHVVDGAFLEDEHVYEFAVAATDQGGDSSLSDLAQARSQHPQPATPTGLAATAGDDGSIALTWDAVGDGAWYWVHMRDVTAGEAELTKLEYPVTSPAHTATGLQQDHVYEFAVASVTRGGDSGLSDRVQATAHHPRPPTPTGLAATARDDGSIALTWESVGEGAWYWIHMRDVTAGETELTRLEYPVTTAGHTATGLTHHHEYEFAVASVTPGGDSEPGDPVRATSRYPTPAAPTGLRATAGDGEVTLEWTASTTPGTWYWIYTRNVTAGEAELTRAAYPVTEPGSTRGWLANGDTYEFRVTAVNQAGESEPTATVSARPLPPRPGKPTGLTATDGTDGSITLAWTAPGPGVYYWVYLRDVTAGEDFQRLGLPLGEVTTHRVTGLRHDHRYEFQLAATNLAGDGPRSDTAAATAHYDRPPAPTGLRAASSGSGTVTLDWESAGEGLYYWVYERDVTAGQTTFTKSGLPTDRLTAQRGFLADGHTYEYKVTAENPGGEGPASATVQVVARADLPAPPTDLRATPGSGTVDLTWTASPTPDVWYWVYHRNVTRHGAWQRVEVPIDGTSHRLGGLTNGETYEIKVTSTSWAGDSAPSNVVTVTPRWPTPGTPTGLTATSIPGAVRLRWNASSTAGAWYWIEYRDVQTGQGWRRAGLPVAGATTHDFSGIPGHDHQFRVVATQAGVDSAPSNVATARPGAPSPPTGLTATAGVASVTLRWTASPTAGVWYWVEYRDTAIGQGWQRVAYPLTGGTTYTMSMLKGHRHEFRVRSTGVTGESTPSNVAAATPLPPAAPTGLTATPQPNKVALRWTASPTPGTWYWVEWRDATTGGGWQRAVYPVTGTSHTVTGLLGHTYQFRVRSIGLAGVSAPSAVVSARPLPPAAPSALTVTAAGNASVSLRWTASPTPDTWYRVYFRDVTAGEGWRASTYPTASTSITMGYLWNGHTYQFKVASLGSAGEGGATNVVSARPMPPLPAPPTGIGAATTGLVEAVQIGWHPSPTPYVTYRVYARDATANGTWVVRGHVGYSPFTVRNLRPGHTYQFFVRAVDYWGRESGNSAMVSARPASTPTVVEYNWWGYEVHMSRRATSSFVDLAHRIADGSEACGILGFLGIPGRVISLICGFAGNVYGAMGDAAAAYHRRGNCATMNVTWVGVPWVNEDRYGTENCY